MSTGNMGNEQIAIVMTVDQWDAILHVTKNAPYFLVDSVGPLLVELHNQAARQIADIQKASEELNSENPQE